MCARSQCDRETLSLVTLSVLHHPQIAYSDIVNQSPAVSILTNLIRAPDRSSDRFGADELSHTYCFDERFGS
jgi:hypothetical protein